MRRAVLGLAGIAAALFAAEMLARIFLPAYRYDAMFHAIPNNGAPCAEYWPSALYGYGLIPNAKPGISSLGMRDREYAPRKPAGVFRIVLLGDSITEHGSWSQVLEDKLNAGGGRCEILNCGVSGWGIANYRAYLQYRGLTFEPDLVLVGFCLNDMVGYSVTGTLLQDHATGGGTYVYLNGGRCGPEVFPYMNNVLFRRSYLARIIVTGMFVRHSAGRAGRDTSFAAAAEMKAMAGGRILAIIFPYLKPLAAYTEQERKEYDTTRDCLARAGIEFLDLTPQFNAYGDRIAAFRNTPADKIHFNDAGNRLKADTLYPWLGARIRAMSRSGAAANQ
jgi:lysophospholipase L1-like esterase